MNDRNNNLGYRQDLSDSRWWICVEFALPWSVGDVEGDARAPDGKAAGKGAAWTAECEGQKCQKECPRCINVAWKLSACYLWWGLSFW